MSLIACAVAGVGLLWVASLRPLIWGIPLPGLIFDLLHDLGIALFVSAVIGGLIETYRNSRHRLESMKEAIDLIMDGKITSEVWIDVNELIEQKFVIRRDVYLRLEMGRDSGLQAHEAVLAVDHFYKIYSLREKRTTFTIRHDLDYQFSRPHLDLPRWDTVAVGPEGARKSPEEFDKSDPKLELEVTLEPRRFDRPVSIYTRRHEVITLPGSYNFYAPEFMKDVTVVLVGCPTEFEAEVTVRPHGGGRALQGEDHTWSFGELIFPGQGIEVKFKEKVRSEKTGVEPLARQHERDNINQLSADPGKD
ncbi:MAG: hypothetical protein ABSC88_10740 [Terracidiphilus sp.]